MTRCINDVVVIIFILLSYVVIESTTTSFSWDFCIYLPSSLLSVIVSNQNNSKCQQQWSSPRQTTIRSCFQKQSTSSSSSSSSLVVSTTSMQMSRNDDDDSESLSIEDENSSYDDDLQPSVIPPLNSRRKNRAQRTAQERRQAYERCRSLWIRKYGSVEALQQTFGRGSVSNFWGGDLSPEQTRRLYHTLLPRSLLGLHEMGLMKPDELAPLAYKARIAAKEYARSRCNLSGKTMTAVFDQYRNLKRYGRFTSSSSMTWEEIWDKYEAQIVQEVCNEELENEKLGKQKKRKKKQDVNTTANNEELTMRIYLRILERSCATNQAFDGLFLKEEANEDDNNSMNFDEIASKLENDVRSILLQPNDSKKIIKKAEEVQKKALKLKRKNDEERLLLFAKEKKKDEKEEEKRLKREKKEAKKNDKKKRKFDSSNLAVELRSNEEYNIDSDDNDFIESTINQQQSIVETNLTRSQRWQVLRILAGTRRKFRTLNKK